MTKKIMSASETVTFKSSERLKRVKSNSISER